jgi:ATP-dependent Clp protease ATP-binding subunit ClpC
VNSWRSLGVPKWDRLAHFTFLARKVFQLANQGAHRLNHDRLLAEHLLLGMVKDDIGVASWLLRDQGCSLLPARAQVEKAGSATSGAVTAGSLPWTADISDAVERASEEGQRLGHPFVGTGHLLLALLSGSAATVERVFADAAPDLAVLRTWVLAGLAGSNWVVVEQDALLQIPLEFTPPSCEGDTAGLGTPADQSS